MAVFSGAAAATIIFRLIDMGLQQQMFEPEFAAKAQTFAQRIAEAHRAGAIIPQSEVDAFVAGLNEQVQVAVQRAREAEVFLASLPDPGAGDGHG